MIPEPLDALVDGLSRLSDQLAADVPLARTREEHVRVTARATSAAQLCETARRAAQSLSEPLNPAYPVI